MVMMRILSVLGGFDVVSADEGVAIIQNNFTGFASSSVWALISIECGPSLTTPPPLASRMMDGELTGNRVVAPTWGIIIMRSSQKALILCFVTS